MTHKCLRLLVCILPLLTIACGGGSRASSVTPPAPSPDFLYTVTTSGTGTGRVFQLLNYKVDSSTGTVSSSSTTSLGNQTLTAIAVNEAPKYLYASFLGPTASIGIFSIDPTSGTPTQKSTYLLANPCICAPGEFELSPNGKFLFLGGSFLGGAVQAIGVLGVDAETGALTAVPGSPFPANQIPYQLAMHPSGQFLFTENVVLTQELLVQSLSTFLVDARTGALSPSAGSPFLLPSNSAGGTLAVHPSGKFLYLTSADAANGIRVWSIDGASGKITVAPGSPYQVGLAIDNAAFDQTGKFLYGSGRETEGITGFDVDANSGALTPMPGSPFSPNSGLGAFTVDPSGRFLIVEDTTNQTLIEFAIDSGTGILTPSGGSVSLSANEPIINIVKAP